MKKSALILLFLLSCAHPSLAAYDLVAYGATCDGVANDSPAFSAVYSAARLAPGIITLPAGSCTVDAGIMTHDVPGIRLVGQGVGITKLLLRTDGDGIRFGKDGANFNDCGGAQDLTIGSLPSRASGNAIHISGCNGGSLHDLKIDRAGDGLVFSCLPEHTINSSCDGSWMVRSLVIEHTGPTAGIRVDADSDRFFTDISIRGDRSVGSRGILITRSGGDWYRSITTLFEEIGISLEPPAGGTIQFVHFDNVYGDSSLENGWRFGLTGGSIRGIDCQSCWSGGVGLPIPLHPEMAAGSGAASIGFKVRNCDGCVFSSSRVWDTGGIGMDVGPAAKNIQVIGGWFSNNGTSAPGTLAGLKLEGVGAQVQGVRSGDVVYPGAGVQGCGVELVAGADQVTVTGGDFRGNALGIGGVCNPLPSSPGRVIAGNR